MLQVAESDTEEEGEESDDSKGTSGDSEHSESPEPPPPLTSPSSCPGDGHVPEPVGGDKDRGGDKDSSSQSESSETEAVLDSLSLENRLHPPHRDQLGHSGCSFSRGGAPLDTQLMRQQVRREVLRQRQRRHRPRVKLQAASVKGKRSAKGNRQAVKAAMSAHF